MVKMKHMVQVVPFAVLAVVTQIDPKEIMEIKISSLSMLLGRIPFMDIPTRYNLHLIRYITSCE